MTIPEIEALEHGIENGDARSMVELGKRFCRGDGVEKSFDKASALFQKAADLEDADGEAWLGRCYWTGKGVSQDRLLSIEMFKRAAQRGNVGAAINLASFLMVGTAEVEKDCSQAARYLERAAEKGSARAQSMLAAFYELGWGVEQSGDKALSLIECAASGGDSDALVSLGDMYEYGKGVPADLARALTLYDRAAKTDVDAEIALYKLIGVGVTSHSITSYDPKKLYEGADCQTVNGDVEPQHLDFECEDKKEIALDSEQFMKLAVACDLNGDFDSGLRFLRKCMSCDDFGDFPYNVRNDILVRVYSRENEKCTEYFDVLSSWRPHTLAGSRLIIFVPADGYEPAIKEEILRCVHAWNAALQERFEIVETDDWEAANIAFRPVGEDLFEGTCDARTYVFKRKRRPTAFLRLSGLMRSVRNLIFRNPFAKYESLGTAELVPKYDRAVIQLPNYQCKSSDDLARLTKYCLHEIGHALGLGHSIFFDDVMSIGRTHKTSLSHRDVYAINKLYEAESAAKISDMMAAGAKRGNKFALRALGIHCFFNKRYAEACELLEKASALDDHLAHVYLGMCYGTGRGVAKDVPKALELLRKAVNSGHPLAHTLLGNCHMIGFGVESDPLKAAPLYEYAAGHGDTEAAKALSIVNIVMGGERSADKAERALNVAEASEAGGTRRLRALQSFMKK